VPSSFEVTVNPVDNSGTIVKVDLLIDGAQVQEDTGSPWNFSVPDGLLSAGTHTITARATDPSGNTQTSLPVHVTVQAASGGSGGAGSSGGGGPGGADNGATISGNCSTTPGGAGDGSLPGAVVLALGALFGLARRKRI